MKQLIRFNTFETNSSTTHAIVICEGEEQEKLWEDGKLYVDWDENIYTIEDLKEDYEKEKDKFTKHYRDSEGYDEDEDISDQEIFDAWLYENDYKNCNTWYEELEQDTTIHTTKSGDKIYIHAAFGYQG